MIARSGQVIITFFSNVYPYPKRGYHPGIERVVESFSNELVKKGHEVHVITTYRNGGEKEEESFNGVNIHRIKDSRDRFGKIGSAFSLDVLSMNWGLTKYLDIIIESDILHVFTPFLVNRPKTPIVSHFHHGERIRSLVDILYLPINNYFWKRTFNSSKTIICVSNHSAKYLNSRGISLYKIAIVPNGVDFDSFNRYAESDIIKKIGNKFGENKIILYVGPLIKRKGLEHLIRGMKNVLSKRTDVFLVLVGKGKNEKKLTRLSLQLGIAENVVFEGFVEEKSLPAYYTSCDIFVLPSLQEGFGMVLVEAMACGKPVIASNNTAIPEVVGDAGVLVDPRSPNGLADAIIDLLNDEEKMRELGEKALKRVQENFTWDSSADKLLRIYRGLMGLSA